VLPWNLRQLISYFFALIILFNKFIKNRQENFATGNAIYPLPRTIIQITIDNSIFRKEGILVINKVQTYSNVLSIPVKMFFNHLTTWLKQHCKKNLNCKKNLKPG
jgi:hypothetical protein